MFLEPVKNIEKRGSIEVICGAMFSGKTEELIRRINRARLAKQKIKILKHGTDTRYHAINVVSHNKAELDATPIIDTSIIISMVANADVIGIDEAQFFDATLVTVCNQLADMGKRIIIAGLDMDYTGCPFGSMPALMAIAEYVTKLHAICMNCGALANYSHRKAADPDLILVGETDTYEALCRKCYLQTKL